MISRRAFFAGLATLAMCDRANALGRKPHGGSLRLRIPWPMDGFDPHAIDDATAALFGPATADSLYALDAAGRPYPALAASLPEPQKGGVRIALRPNLLSALGRPMDGRDLIWSLTRAGKSGAASLLGPLGKPTADPKEPLTITLTAHDPNATAIALASPLTAILPRAFSRNRPDGTGAFSVEVTRDTLTLKKNLNAARGAAFLDRIESRQAPDLKEPLRAFEASETDASWLGEFLHKPRAGALKYDAGLFGWVVLKTGKDAGRWGAPGIAQTIADAIPSGRFSHLGVTSVGSGGGGDPAWSGEAAEILVVEGSTHLELIGKDLAALLSRPGHELRVNPRPRTEIDYRREQGRYALLLDFMRPVGNGPRAMELGLLTAASPTLAQKPPTFTSSDPRSVARSLPLGIIGQLRISGAYASNLHDFATWDLANVWKK